MKAGLKDPVSDDRGSAIIIVLVILVVLTLLGQIATRTTTTEIEIAANDKRHRMTFYAADGATELASELLEQNIDELGFDGNPDFDPDPIDPNIGTFSNFIGINVVDFWRNGEDISSTPSDTNRDFFLPADYVAGEPHTNFTVGGDPEFAHGAGIMMAAGYEGMGKGSAHGGSLIAYEVITQRVGDKNSESIVRVKWRHVN
jgi:hypothetical protein